MRRWAFPLLAGLAAALVAYQVALVLTPRVLMWAALRRVEQVGGVDVLRHPPMATARSRAIVRPSPDLAYSSCVLDLAKGPVLIDVRPLPAPYWSLSVFDGRTDTIFVRNNRDSRDGPVRVAVARPGQDVPSGVEAVRMTSRRGIALLRILVEDRARFPQVDRARRASRCGRI